GEQFRDDEAPPAADPDIMNGDDPGVPELGELTGFLREPVSVGAGSLDRDRAVQPAVEPAEDRAEAAFAELLADLVAVPERGRQVREEVVGFSGQCGRVTLESVGVLIGVGGYGSRFGRGVPGGLRVVGRCGHGAFPAGVGPDGVMVRGSVRGTIIRGRAELCQGPQEKWRAVSEWSTFVQSGRQGATFCLWRPDPELRSLGRPVDRRAWFDGCDQARLSTPGSCTPRRIRHAGVGGRVMTAG